MLLTRHRNGSQHMIRTSAGDLTTRNEEKKKRKQSVK